MVQSKIDKTVNYPETKDLNADDRDYDADLFEIFLFGDDRIIAVGQPQFLFIEKNIVYYPVYIIKDERVDSQIGVYEILSDQQPSILDEDGDLDISRMGDLLLYSFVTEKYIKGDDASSPSPEKDAEGDGEEGEEEDEEEDGEEDEEDGEEGEEEEDDEDEDDDEGIRQYGFSPLQKQNAKAAKKERDAYKKAAGADWIANFMHNNNYKLVDNEGGGDCLFAAIRDGLARAGIVTTVAELRDKIANEATEQIFQGYKQMYDMSKNEVDETDRILKDLSKQHKDVKNRAKKRDISREEVVALIDQANDIGNQHKRVKKEKKLAQQLFAEYAFMRGVDNLEAFKAKIRTCSFWGETWAISTIERVMNIKLVLFSLEAYNHRDYDNTLLCGQLNDKQLEERGRFEPSHYVLLEYMGAHYRLVTYKERGAFTFQELPFDVKTLIVEKCLEKQAGPYYIIPDFRSFMSELNIVAPEIGPDGAIIGDDDDDDNDDDHSLHDDKTIFQFYSKSSNSMPGKGSGEKIKEEDRALYAELAAMPDWRKRLSNFWIESFELDGHTWSSVEHYYQASKFKENNHDFYLTFALDMNPEGQLALDPALAKATGGKTGKFKGKRVRPAEVKIDPNFFAGRHTEEMKAAQHAKFTQNEELKNLLILTRDAKLNHFQRGSPPVTFTSLMEIRKDLSREKK